VLGAALAYAIALRWREGVVLGLALVPSLLALYFWKDRGLGYVPALSLEQTRLAAGSGAAFLDLNLDRYVDLDFEHWREQMGQLREYFWSARLAQWAPIAGLLAVLRMRRWAIAGLLAGWLGAFIVVKGFSERASIETNTFWRLLMPAWPAYLLLLAAIPLLVPTLARRLGARVDPPRRQPVRARWIAVVAVLTIAIPVAATAASEQLQPPSPDAIVQAPGTATILTPVDEGIELETERVGDGQRLTWSSASDWRANVFYRVYRMDDAETDLQCVTRAEAAWECYMVGTPIATTRDREYIDPAAPPGAIYRIGVGTNWVDDPEQGDIFVFSPQIRAAS
jgi:hypothetical protein